MPHGCEIYIGFSPLHPFIVDTQFKKKKSCLGKHRTITLGETGSLGGKAPFWVEL